MKSQHEHMTGLVAALDVYGLRLMGHFTLRVGETIAPIASGAPAASLALIGHVGSSHWAAFSQSPEYLDKQADPLDRWSRRIGDAVAAAVGGRAVYPFEGPPFYPFQRWAMRARSVHVSPLGILIDPESGLWQAYRFALLLPQRMPDSVVEHKLSSPCVTCDEQPCLSVCPADACTMSGFDHQACAQYLLASHPSPCSDQVCLARAACPVGSQNRYCDSHARFHMRAFMKGLRHGVGK